MKEIEMANKFKAELEVTGFKLKIEGSREDIPLMTQALGQQMSTFIPPVTNVVEGKIVDNHQDLPQLLPETKPANTRKKRSTRKYFHSPTNSSKKNQVTAIDWRHDPMKWGNPQQTWSATDKSIWLLYVVAKETGIKELQANQIAATFNKHFQESKKINTGQINRDLRNAKTKKPVLVSEDLTNGTSVWYLTIEGEKRAKELIDEALKPTT